jgi:hypothetical protein
MGKTLSYTNAVSRTVLANTSNLCESAADPEVRVGVVPQCVE